MSDLERAYALIEDISHLARVVLSGSRRNHTTQFERVDIRPVEIKGELQYQTASHDGRKVFTKNYLPGRLNIRELLASGYGHITIEHEGGLFSGRFTKKDEFLAVEKKGHFVADTAHDKSKKRLLRTEDPFLRLVGITDESGTIKPRMMDKYMQIEKFLRLTSPEISKIEGPLNVVDFGAGSGYLSFALHQYCVQEGRRVEITCVDIQEEFELKNTRIAKELGISDSIHFVTSSIEEYSVKETDIVIALHACDTATDDALAWAVRANSRLIFVAPCCHHDIQRQMKVSPQPWDAITRHGIMKERLGDLITDALRMEILEESGYRCDAIEFISDGHTPRNLMIKARYTGTSSTRSEYQQLSSQWGVESALHRALANR